MSIKTYTPSCTITEADRKWFLIDAEDIVLGRLASTVAMILRGKHKPVFTPHNDCGDHVVIINAEKVYLTGNKREGKIYYRHTGYPGGLKQRTAAQILEGRFPERVIEKAVQRMIPSGSLGRKVLKKLHIVAGPEHPYAAQKPEVFEFAERNPKNKKRGA